MAEEKAKNILELPAEILGKIIKFVPTPSRVNLSASCKQLNEAVCQVERFKYKLRITDENMKDEAILVTKKIFDEISIRIDRKADETTIKNLTEILRVHGAKITKMNFYVTEFSTVPISANSISNFFAKVPNMEYLEISFVRNSLRLEENPQLEPVLEKVKILSLQWLSGFQGLWKIFKPNTIRKLEVLTEYRELEQLVSTQSSIDNLFIGYEALSKFDCFSKIHLKELKFESEFNGDSNYEKEDADYVHQMILQHPQLERLVFEENCGIYLKTFVEICGMKKLHTLCLSVSQRVFEEIDRLESLQQIKSLMFSFLNENHIEPFLRISSIPFENLTSVYFRDLTFNDTRIIDNIAINWPHLKELTINNSMEGGVNYLNAFLDKLPKLESLIFHEDTIIFDSNQKQKYVFHNYDQLYPNIKMLHLNGNSQFDSLRDLVKCLPNLEDFYFEDSITKCTLYSPKILQTFIKLKHLKALGITFSFGSRFVQFTQKDMQLVLKLFSKLKKCAVKFYEKDNISEEVLEIMRQDANVPKVKIDASGALLMIKNYQWFT